jgi:isopentenyldiphosphate isomerase
MSASTDEWIDLVDDQDLVVGRVTRLQMREKNLWHRSVAILCQNSRGEIYVHRRTPTKDVFPGLYDVTVGGVVGAGESYDAAAVRELAEELGISDPTPQSMFRHRYAGPHSRAHVAVYSVIWDGPIVHQQSEIAWGGFCTVEEVMANPQGWQFVPDGLEVFYLGLPRLRG